MHPRRSRLLALGSASCLLAAGCAPVSPGEATGPFSGANAGLAASSINRAGTANVATSFATGAPSSAITNATTAIIAKHQASVRQRAVAQQRARQVYTKLVARQQASLKAVAVSPAKTKPGAKMADARLPKPYHVPRYIAVDTEKDAQDVPGTKKAVMIWDTQTQDIVGNNVYDIATPPAVGSNSRFETFSAEYVGAGL